MSAYFGPRQGRCPRRTDIDLALRLEMVLCLQMTTTMLSTPERTPLGLSRLGFWTATSEKFGCPTGIFKVSHLALPLALPRSTASQEGLGIAIAKNFTIASQHHWEHFQKHGLGMQSCNGWRQTCWKRPLMCDSQELDVRWEIMCTALARDKVLVSVLEQRSYAPIRENEPAHYNKKCPQIF